MLESPLSAWEILTYRLVLKSGSMSPTCIFLHLGLRAYNFIQADTDRYLLPFLLPDFISTYLPLMTVLRYGSTAEARLRRLGPQALRHNKLKSRPRGRLLIPHERHCDA